LVEINVGVRGNIWTRVVIEPRDGPVLSCRNSRQMYHVKVAAAHELDGHVFPHGVRVLVTFPFDMAHAAHRIDDAWSRDRRSDVCAGEEGSEEECECESVEHGVADDLGCIKERTGLRRV